MIMSNYDRFLLLNSFSRLRDVIKNAAISASSAFLSFAKDSFNSAASSSLAPSKDNPKAKMGDACSLTMPETLHPYMTQDTHERSSVFWLGNQCWILVLFHETNNGTQNTPLK
ncbi:hypothetical protein CGRA01v4_10759 [Colletotrichum graminicola]|nr:hypothetical protein CGRA01v4_10759 [Colletotrichum graminicola]